jgi:hypothetical protein
LFSFKFVLLIIDLTMPPQEIPVDVWAAYEELADEASHHIRLSKGRLSSRKFVPDNKK